MTLWLVASRANNSTIYKLNILWSSNIWSRVKILLKATTSASISDSWNWRIFFWISWNAFTCFDELWRWDEESQLKHTNLEWREFCFVLSFELFWITQCRLEHQFYLYTFLMQEPLLPPLEKNVSTSRFSIFFLVWQTIKN